ncbi:MAG: plasmid pRiA4b ORF-3 family protein [Pseudonocardia sp.]
MAPDPLLTDAVAPAARRCEALTQARRLAIWVGAGKRVTPKQVLRPSDVPDAARVLAVTTPKRFTTAANVPTLHRLWTVAMAVGFLRIADGHAVAGPALAQWRDADDPTVCELWLTGLTAAVTADTHEEDEAEAVAFARFVLAALAADPPPSVFDLWTRSLEQGADEGYIAEPFFSAYQRRDNRPALIDLLIQFGAAVGDATQLRVTPLSRWALQELQARMPEPITDDLPAEILIARLAQPGGRDPWRDVQPWLTGRHPTLAARDLLAAAATATPAQRIAAVDVVDALGESVSVAWREVTTIPNLAAHARAAFQAWDSQAELSDDDIVWLAVDHAMAALVGSGPDEALSCLDEQLDGAGIDSRIRAAKDSDHPDAAELTEALVSFLASGATPTASVGYQLKISLRRARPPIWRRVIMPAATRLSQLHLVIQIVMNWGGDHLHAFTVGHERYGDSFYTHDMLDEDQLRLSGAFTRNTTIGYLYDFGASWHHEVTLEKVLDLDVGTTYPVCLTGRGDFPIEYWNEEEDAQDAVPFDVDTINRRLHR